MWWYRPIQGTDRQPVTDWEHETSPSAQRTHNPDDIQGQRAAEGPKRKKQEPEMEQPGKTVVLDVQVSSQGACSTPAGDEDNQREQARTPQEPPVVPEHDPQLE